MNRREMSWRRPAPRPLENEWQEDYMAGRFEPARSIGASRAKRRVLPHTARFHYGQEMQRGGRLVRRRAGCPVGR